MGPISNIFLVILNYWDEPDFTKEKEKVKGTRTTITFSLSCNMKNIRQTKLCPGVTFKLYTSRLFYITPKLSFLNIFTAKISPKIKIFFLLFRSQITFILFEGMEEKKVDHIIYLFFASSEVKMLTFNSIPLHCDGTFVRDN